jgi:hypothetical protein
VIIEFGPLGLQQIAALGCFEDMGQTEIISQAPIVTPFSAISIKYVTDL